MAWHPLGWKPAFFAEIERFPSAVLAHHYPHVPNWGDITKFAEWPDANLNVLVGGTPCQSFSVAGLREGLDDPRGNLLLTYLGIAKRYRPDWVVWENVPGVLSSSGGRDFGLFLWALGQLGYGWAYRILDAQYFNLAQRRARVFVVASTRGWQRAAAVLFERASLQGNPAPRREAREDVAGTIAGGARKRSGFSYDDIPQVAGTLTRSALGWSSVCAGDGREQFLVPAVANTLTARMYKGINTTLDEGQTPIPVCFDETSHGRPPTIAFNARQDPHSWSDVTGPLDSDGTTQGIAFDTKSQGQNTGDVAPTMKCMSGAHANAGGQLGALTAYGVRRLTPRECERLQGFEDDYTLIQYHGRARKPAKDGPRYKALGNSKAVSVIRWIGERIQMVDKIK